MKICDELNSKGILDFGECKKWLRALLKIVLAYIDENPGYFLQQLSHLLQELQIIRHKYEAVIQDKVCNNLCLAMK